MMDLTDELAAAAATAGLDRAPWEKWLGKSEDNLASMHAIARIQQVTHQRLSNPQYPWRVDLSDTRFPRLRGRLR